MKLFQEYLDSVNMAIATIPYPQHPGQLYEPIAYHMALGGKRVRPVLTLMACDAMGCDSAMAIDAAVGLEMFHNFTLLHDDVMDNADVRRGKPAVHRRWDDNTAILSGDTMLTIATQYIARTANWQVMAGIGPLTISYTQSLIPLFELNDGTSIYPNSLCLGLDLWYLMRR